ncbi:MAG TPA: cytochrome C oxidase subunit IV family protein [Caulobacteraceae bacterium]|jgi:cytochrome c oxidase subunit 4
MKISDRDREIILVPVLVWIGLMVALAVTVTYAFWPHAPVKVEVALVIAAIKAALIAIVYMRLSRSPPLLRLAAVAAFLWLLMLFGLTFADYLTRAPG